MNAMKKRYSLEKLKLSTYEQEIEDGVNYTKLKKPSKEKIKFIKETATNTLKELKKERTNIRMNEADIGAIKELAKKFGLPYQTLISHILHLYVTHQLVNINEVKKLLKAGLLNDQKIKGSLKRQA